MNYVKRPKEEKVLLQMQRLYLNTERKLIAEIGRKRAAGYVDYAEVAALERVQKILTEMQSEAFEYVPIMVETIFHGEGEKNAAGYENARTLTSTQIDVTQTLINNLLGEIVEASETALESARIWLSFGRMEADEFREAALRATASQQALGASWIMAQKNMAVDLNAQGITAYVDKAGRRWTLTDYCTMATRTTARQASVAANLTRDDYDLWQISKIGSTCPVCAVYEGRVYSKSGTNPDYPPLAMAFGKIDPAGSNDLSNTYLNIHPNCLHSLMKYTTIGKSEKEIQRDKDFSSFEKNPITHDPRTKKQIKAYREKEKNRRRLLDTRNQWNRYKAALGDDIPGFDTFRAHKQADDDTYKKWMSKYRAFRKEANSIFPTEKIIPDIVPEVEFTPTNTIEEAIDYAKQYVEKSFMDKTFKGDVVLKGVSLENANEINRALTNVYERFPDLDKLSGIKAISPTSAQGKKAFTSSDAVFAYDPVQNGVYVNKDILKNADSFADYLKESEEAWETVMNNIKSLSGAQKELALIYKNAGRDLVGKNVQELFEHELGHHIQWTYLDTSLNNEIGSKMSEFAPRISGYANASKSEYLAESFTAYLRGEKNLLDPKYVEFLDKKAKPLKISGKGVENAGEGVIIKTSEGSMKMDLQYFAKVPDRKLTNYALDFDKQPNKAKAFELALGYNKSNSNELKKAIEENFDEEKLLYKGKDKFGDRYEQIMSLTGPNGKTANVLTGWIKKPDEDYSLTSLYVTKKKARK